MKRATKSSAVLGALAALCGCASSPVQQNTIDIRGRTLDDSADIVRLDLGSADHVASGNEFTVYHANLVGNPKQVP